MNRQNKINLIIAVFIGIILIMACGGNQQEEANKLVTDANKQLEDAKTLFQKATDRNEKLFTNSGVTNNAQLAAYKSRMTDEAKGIVADFEKASAMLKEVSQKYEKISKMNLVDKYKEYAKLKSDAFSKRAEGVDVCKSNAKAFLDNDDVTALQSKFKETNAKSDQLFKEADDLADKAKKIEDENKEIFKDTK